MIGGQTGKLPNDGRRPGDVTFDGISAVEGQQREISKEKHHMFGEN